MSILLVLLLVLVFSLKFSAWVQLVVLLFASPSLIWVNWSGAGAQGGDNGFSPFDSRGVILSTFAVGSSSFILKFLGCAKSNK